MNVVSQIARGAGASVAAFGEGLTIGDIARSADNGARSQIAIKDRRRAKPADAPDRRLLDDRVAAGRDR
ncbi:MAG: hypothetical protein WEB56_09300 [Roseovarius sp.]